MARDAPFAVEEGGGQGAVADGLGGFWGEVGEAVEGVVGLVVVAVVNWDWD